MKKTVWKRGNWRRPSWRVILAVVLTVLSAIYLLKNDFPLISSSGSLGILLSLALKEYSEKKKDADSGSPKEEGAEEGSDAGSTEE